MTQPDLSDAFRPKVDLAGLLCLANSRPFKDIRVEHEPNLALP